MRCPDCKSSSLQYLNSRTKDGKKIEMYKCEECKKYVLKKGNMFFVQPDAPRPINIVVKGTGRVPIVVPKPFSSCDICGKEISEDRMKKGSVTCGKVCSAVHNQRKKDDYHKLRKLKLYGNMEGREVPSV